MASALQVSRESKTLDESVREVAGTSPRSAPSALASRIGFRGESYRLEEVVGFGGMGVVYRARGLRRRTEVAIKFLREPLAHDPVARARLAREVRIASALRHPGIGAVHGMGETGGHRFLVMEYVPGRTLRAQIGPAGLSLADVARLGAQIAEAIAHLHAQRVVHRDLKASNVIVGPEGRVKVVDFGLAATLDQAPQTDASLTTPGALVGTVAYLSPEVLRGEAATPRSDVWALGVLLYEMACGARPFRGETCFALAGAVLHRPVPALPPRVPAALRAVVLGCLLRDPGRRAGSAAGVAAALRALEPRPASLPA